MSNPTEPVVVARELEALIPVFLANRRRELEALRAALAARDFGELCRIGHRMKGAGASYGFQRISSFGEAIETAAQTPDPAAVAAGIDAYAAHLSALKVTYA